MQTEVSDYDGLIRALRARADELSLTRECLDDVSGLQSGYSSKLLTLPPMRSLGRVSLGLLLGALGLKLIVAEDAAALARVPGQFSKRQAPLRAIATHKAIVFRISRAKLKRIGSLGGKKRAENLTAKQRQRNARKAARARWRKLRKNVVAPMSAFGQ